MYRISFVCTGNRCRSATAAAILRRLTEGLPVTVDSCGTLDLEGKSSPRETVTAAARLGIDLGEHRSRFLGNGDLAGSDLVVGFEHQHSAAAVVEGGAPASKTFSLLELVRLLEHIEPITAEDPVQRAAEAVAAAHRIRSQRKAFVPGEKIADPIGAPLEVHVEMTTELVRLCQRLVSQVFGLKPRPHGLL